MNETKTGWNQAMLTGGQEGLAQLHWGIVILFFFESEVAGLAGPTQRRESLF